MMMLSRLKEDDQVALRAYRLFVRRLPPPLLSVLVRTLTSHDYLLSSPLHQVKERLYRFNYVRPALSHPALGVSSPDWPRFEQEILSQLEKHERIEKLEETFQAVKADYRRILDRAAIQV